MTSFKVQAEDLTAHASHLEGLTDRLDTAISAAESVSMSDEAYGILCSFLPPIVNPMEQEGLNALKAAKEGVTVTADNVRSSAKDYLDTDDANSGELKKFDEAVKVNRSAVALHGVPAVDGGGAQQEGTPAMHARQQGTPVAEPQQRGESVDARHEGTPVMQPHQQGTRPAEQGTPVAEPQHRAATPAMQGDLRPTERNTPA